MKNFLKLAFAYGAYCSGISRLTEKICSPKINILYYHQILPKSVKDQVLNIHKVMTVENFEKQMDFINKNYTLLNLNQVYDILHLKKKIPKRAVAITFDDGYRDNYQYAFPILKKYDIPATIFLTTDPIDRNESLWWDDLSWFLFHNQIKVEDLSDSFPQNIKSELIKLSDVHKNDKIKNILKIITYIDKFNHQNMMKVIDEIKGLSKSEDDYKNKHTQFLTWEMIYEMQKTGLITFGVHSKSHPILTSLEKELIVNEIEYSKKRIEEQIANPVDIFCFPKGCYNNQIKNILKDFRFKLAFTSVYGSNDHKTDLLQLKRKDGNFFNLNGKHYNIYQRLEMSEICNKLFFFRS